MQVRKAVITAAGRGVRQYPASDTVQKAMLPMVDRDGLTKPAIQIIAEEALESGIEEICVVTAPGDDAVYRRHFRAFDENLLQAFGGERVQLIAREASVGTPVREARYGREFWRELVIVVLLLMLTEAWLSRRGVT